MGYIASSHVYNGTGGVGGTSISATLPVACAAGDVVLAMVSCASGGGTWDVSSVTSSNISWSQVINFDHTANDQRFRLFRGKVNTGFSASSEVLTGNFSGGSPTYRHIDCVAYTPDSGKVFASEPVQQNDQDTYAAASNPTSTDGYSCSMTTTGSNSFIWVAALVVEDTTSNSVNNASAGTTATLRGSVHSMFDGAGTNMFPFLWEDKAQASSGAGTITATHAESSDDMSSLVAVALEMVSNEVPNGGQADQTIDQVYTWAVNTLHCTHIWWRRGTLWAGTVLPYLRTHQNLVTTAPSMYGGQINTN